MSRETEQEIVAAAERLVQHWLDVNSEAGMTWAAEAQRATRFEDLPPLPVFEFPLTHKHATDLTNAVMARRTALAIAILGTSPGASVVGSPETSAEAARLITPKAGSIRRRVLYEVWLRADRMMSDEMLERELRGRHQTVSSARNWLTEQGFLRDSGQRGKNGSGRRAVLWTLTDDGLRIAADLASEEN